MEKIIGFVAEVTNSIFHQNDMKNFIISTDEDFTTYNKNKTF